MGLRDGDNAVGGLSHLLSMLPGGQCQHIAAPGLYLHDIAHGLLKELGIGPQGHHQSTFLDQTDGAVLEFAGGIGLGVDIGDLLELQGAFQSQGIIYVTPNEKYAVVVEVLAGIVLDIVLIGEDLLHLRRQQQHLFQHTVVFLHRHGAQKAGQVQPQQIQNSQLGGISLRGSYGDLRSCPGIEHLVGLPGDGGTHHIDNGEDSGPQPLGFPQCRHGIQRLSRLADHNDQRPVIHNGVHIPEFGGQRHFHRNAQDPLQVILSDHPHMVGRSTGHDIKLMHTAQIFLRQLEVLQEHLAVTNAGEDRPAHSLRLLHDLLEHEVLIAALFRCIYLPIHMGDLFLHRLHQVVIALDTVLGQYRHLAVIHIAHFAGMADNGRNITGQEVAALTIAKDQGTVLAYGNELIRLVGADDAQSIRSLDTPHHPAHCLQNAYFVRLTEILDQLGHYFGIRLRSKGHPLVLQEGFQFRIIFNNAVVHHSDAAAAADLGVAVDVGRCAVGSPPGMAHTDGTFHRSSSLEHVAEDLQPSFGLIYRQALIPLGVHRHTS